MIERAIEVEQYRCIWKVLTKRLIAKGITIPDHPVRLTGRKINLGDCAETCDGFSDYCEYYHRQGSKLLTGKE